MIKVSASILNCNSMQLGQAIESAEKGGADFIHIDVMDGHYVENLAFSPQMVSDMKKITQLPLSVHLEVIKPENFLAMFAKAGADSITFQLDACPNPIHFIKEIKKCGIKAGVGIGPSHGVEALRYMLHHIDSIILMSVEPGYGGQQFEESIYEKIRRVCEIMEETNCKIPIGIDGSVTPERGKKLVQAGAEILIAGTYLFGSGNVSENIKNLKTAVEL